MDHGEFRIRVPATSSARIERSQHRGPVLRLLLSLWHLWNGLLGVKRGKRQRDMLFVCECQNSGTLKMAGFSLASLANLHFTPIWWLRGSSGLVSKKTCPGDKTARFTIVLMGLALVFSVIVGLQTTLSSRGSGNKGMTPVKTPPGFFEENAMVHSQHP